MKRLLALLLAVILCFALVACGSSSDSSADEEEGAEANVDTAEEVQADSQVPGQEDAEEAEEVSVAGEYSFTESAMGGAFDVLWTLTLNEDGTFTLVENGIMGTNEYTGDSYSVDGTSLTTGPLEGGTPYADFFNDDLSCDWEIDVAAGTVVPVNYDASAEASLESSEESDADYPSVAYASESTAQVMDIYLPDEPTGSDPVIIVCHGGGFKFGTQTMDIIQPVIAAGTANGYVVAAVDYRKSTEATFPAAVADVKAAVRYLKANADLYGIDADQIVIWGESAGAYLAAMTALTPDVEELNGDVTENLEYTSVVNALVDFYGPIEFYTMDDEFIALGNESAANHSVGSFESDFVGVDDMTVNEETVYQTWWKTYVDQLPADFSLQAWIQAGTSDSSVPYTQSENFAAALAEVIGEENVHFSLIEGAEHEDDLFYTDENLAQVFDFLDAALN